MTVENHNKTVAFTNHNMFDRKDDPVVETNAALQQLFLNGIGTLLVRL